MRGRCTFSSINWVAGDVTRKEEEIEEKLNQKLRLLKNMRESLSADLNRTEVEDHPAVLVQLSYVEALKWVLESEKESGKHHESVLLLDKSIKHKSFVIFKKKCLR